MNILECTSTQPLTPLDFVSNDRADVAPLCPVCASRTSRLIYEGLSCLENPGYKRYNMRVCDDCGLLYVFPRPTKEMLRLIYSDVNYREETRAVRRPEECVVEMHSLKKIRRYRTTGRILDIGCGAGSFLACAREFGWDGCGVEIAEHNARFARDIHGLRVVDSVDALNNNEMFDVITLIAVIEHIQYPLQFLKDVTRFLRRDGLVFILTDNHRSWMHWLMRDKFPFIIPEHLQLFTPKSISIMLQRAGLEHLETSSKETISNGAAVRGMSVMFGKRAHATRIAELAVSPLVALSLPLRWLLWKINWGAQIYCLARKAS